MQNQEYGWLGLPETASWPTDEYSYNENPFINYRQLLWSYNRFLKKGLTDKKFIQSVESLNSAVCEISPTGFKETPLLFLEELSETIGQTGGIWAKNETINVAGSHKARHLFGLALHLEIEEVPLNQKLTISSCGNAALAASYIAKASGRPLIVNVPTWADPSLLDELSNLGSEIQICERGNGELGDPCMIKFREAIAAGAIPFSCQGTENFWTIDGGKTLGFELSKQLHELALNPSRLLIQVGGGALASSTVQALTEAKNVGFLANRPALNTVQSEGCSPLARSFNQIVDTGDPIKALAEASKDSTRFMSPWENPSSNATGILDDITYDWIPLVWDMTCGDPQGGPVVASETDILKAHTLIKEQTQISADSTGTAGLAGLLAARKDNCIDASETVLLLITGKDRGY